MYSMYETPRATESDHSAPIMSLSTRVPRNSAAMVSARFAICQRNETSVRSAITKTPPSDMLTKFQKNNGVQIRASSPAIAQRQPSTSGNSIGDTMYSAPNPASANNDNGSNKRRYVGRHVPLA